MWNTQCNFGLVTLQRIREITIHPAQSDEIEYFPAQELLQEN